jgi:hypothetical protein
MNDLPRGGDYFVQKLLNLGREIRGAVLSARARNHEFAGVNRHTSADTIYQLDTHVEPIIKRFCEHWGREMPLVLVAEGFGDDERPAEGQGGMEGKQVFPAGATESQAGIRIICDPIDGTRGLMYDKRSAWFLAGVAPNLGDQTRLSHIEAAVQVEIPTSKQFASDLLWAIRGQGARGMREEVCATVFQKSHDLALRPSNTDNITHGFASIANFFPSTKILASRLMELIAEACIDSTDRTRGIVFDDQYISTGGQFYELIMGHDRFIADLRPLFYRIQGLPPGICVHPYDVAGLLIATEAGVEITDGLGGALDGPLDVTTPLHWAGFANAALRERIEPVMVRHMQMWLARGA